MSVEICMIIWRIMVHCIFNGNVGGRGMTIGGEERQTMCLFVSGDEWNKINDQIEANGKRKGGE